MDPYNLMEAEGKKGRKRAAKPSAEEPDTVKRSHKSQSGFRLKGKCLFLTYPRTDGDRQELLDFLLEKLAKWNVLKYIVCKEMHEDQAEGDSELNDVGDEHLQATKEHFHCYLELERQCDIGKPDYLDWNGHHGNYKTTRCRYAAICYCTKEDEHYLSTEGWDLQQEVAKARVSTALKAFNKGAMNKELLEGAITDEFMIAALEQKLISPQRFKTVCELRDYILKKQQLVNAITNKRVKKFYVTDDRPWIDGTQCLKTRFLVDFDLPEEQQRLHPCVFWYFGGNCTGKSYLAAHQRDLEGNLIPYFEPCAKNEDWSGYKGEQIIVFNEFGGTKSPKDLIRMTEGAQQNCKYGKTISLPRDVIVILTSNQSPTHVFRNFINEPANESNWKAFLQRCQIVELTGRNPDMPNARTPLISGPPEQSLDWHSMTLQEKSALLDRLDARKKEDEAMILQCLESMNEEERVRVMDDVPTTEEIQHPETSDFDWLLQAREELELQPMPEDWDQEIANS